MSTAHHEPQVETWGYQALHPFGVQENKSVCISISGYRLTFIAADCFAAVL